jgi:phage terminase large subunit-like protein
MLRLVSKKRLKLCVELVDPGALDKVARAMRVQPIAAAGQLWTPDRNWADMVKDEMEYFPRSKYDDLTDSTTQALWWMRCAGYLTRREERRMEEEDAMSAPAQPAAPLYPG